MMFPGSLWVRGGLLPGRKQGRKEREGVFDYEFSLLLGQLWYYFVAFFLKLFEIASCIHAWGVGVWGVTFFSCLLAFFFFFSYIWTHPRHHNGMQILSMI